MNMDTTWPEYLRALSTNQSAIARAAGVNTGTVSRWMSGQIVPKAEQVINVARQFDESPLGALVAAGYLEAAEIPNGIVMPRVLQLQRFSDLELAREMFARAVINRNEPVNDALSIVDRMRRHDEALERNELSEMDASAQDEDEAPFAELVDAADKSDGLGADEDFDADPESGEQQGDR